MKHFQIRLLGTEVFACVFGSEDSEYEEDETGISGGSAQNFERDGNPPDPMREEPWEDRLGFRA